VLRTVAETLTLQAVRAGDEPGHVGDLQDECATPRLTRMPLSRSAVSSAIRSCWRTGELMLFDRAIANPPFSL